MSSNATEEVLTCANCGKDADNQYPCTKCLNAPDYSGGELATTFFCSLDCQSKYEPRHIRVCRAAHCRMTLYRAGHTTQLIFQRCHEALSNIALTKVECNGKDMYIYQASDLSKQPLPSLSSVFDSEDDKQAAIACMASGAAIPFVRALLEHMIPEHILRFVQVDYTIKDPARYIITIQPDGTKVNNAFQTHSILQITLNNNESSAIDITGNQYGFPNPVVPWEIYRTSRIQEVCGVKLVPKLADDRMQIKDDGEYQFVASLVKAVEEWEKVNWPMVYVLKGGWTAKEEDYLQWQGELVEHVDRWVKDYVAKKEEARIAGLENNQQEMDMAQLE